LEDITSGSIGVGSLWKNTDLTFPQQRNAFVKIFLNKTNKKYNQNKVDF
jgi:hypothetical protein